MVRCRGLGQIVSSYCRANIIRTIQLLGGGGGIVPDKSSINPYICNSNLLSFVENHCLQRDRVTRNVHDTYLISAFRGSMSEEMQVTANSFIERESVWRDVRGS